MFCFIDSSDSDRCTVALCQADGTALARRTIRQPFAHAEKMLPTLAALLKQTRTTLAALTGVAVVIGPGGFTSIRIGVSTANALAFSIGIPVVGLRRTPADAAEQLMRQGAIALRHARLGVLVAPQYGHRPNITMAKHRLAA